MALHSSQGMNRVKDYNQTAVNHHTIEGLWVMANIGIIADDLHCISWTIVQQVFNLLDPVNVIIRCGIWLIRILAVSPAYFVPGHILASPATQTSRRARTAYDQA